MLDVSRNARKLRNTAIRLLEIAADMESRPRTVATTRAEMATCDRCGASIVGLNWIGERCTSTLATPGATRMVMRPCPGTYRLDPEPDLVRLSDGRVLPVTTGQLAAQQAAQDFRLAGDAAVMLDDGEDDLEAIRAGGGS